MEFKDKCEPNDYSRESVISRESSYVHSTRVKLKRRKALFIDPLENKTVFDQETHENKNEHEKRNSAPMECKGCVFDDKFPDVPKKTDDKENAESDISIDTKVQRKDSFLDAMHEQLNNNTESETMGYSDESDIDEVISRQSHRKSVSMQNLISKLEVNPSETYLNLLNILNHESRHLGFLASINQYKHILEESKVDSETVWSIFSNIEELFEAQKKLVGSLENMINDWESHRHSFTNLMDLYIFLHNRCKEYAKNVSNGIKELDNLFNKNPNFKKALKTVVHEGRDVHLNALLSAPTNWLCNSINHIKCLLNHVDPVDKEVLESTVEKLKDVKKPDDASTVKHVNERTKYIRSDLFVDVLNPGSGNEKRKLRHLYLFSGMVVCVKRKLQLESRTDNSKSTGQAVSPSADTSWHIRCDDKFEIKWVIPLEYLLVHQYKVVEPNDKRRGEITNLKERVRNLKMQMITEHKKLSEETEPTSTSKKIIRTASNNFPIKKLLARKEFEKICQNIFRAQSELLLLSPNCQFPVSDSSQIHSAGSKPHHILLVPSIRDIETWKWEMLRAQNNLARFSSDANTGSVTNIISQTSNLTDCLSVDSNTLYNLIDQKPCDLCSNHIATNPLKSDDGLTGLLTVTIDSVSNINPDYHYYLAIEIDSFKLTELRARTKIISGQKVLTWNESFDLELDCSLELVVLLYQTKSIIDNQETLVGFFKKKIDRSGTKGKPEELKTDMLGNTNVEFSLKLSCNLVSNDTLMKREPSMKKTVLFGVPLRNVVSRESKLIAQTNRSVGLNQTKYVHNVPLILQHTLGIIEDVGLDEEGIYRISGSKLEINELYKKFNKNVQNTLKDLHKLDLHTLTGIVKMYLRELPDPLMTPDNYKPLIQNARETDVEKKFETYDQIINKLPEPNKSTFLFLIDHFKKVCDHSSKNQMIAGNLGLILGPTLIMPGDNNPAQPNKVFGITDIAFETFNSFALANIFTQILNGYLNGQLPYRASSERTNETLTNQQSE